MPDAPDAEEAIAATRRWVERAVIGLNLCPFAKAVHVKGLIRYVVSDARTPDALLEDLERELGRLADRGRDEVETTLIIHPHVLVDFLDYNDFLEQAEDAVDSLGLDGMIQVASFHPQYQFAGTAPDDIGNYTNRSPYPTLHLLREAGVDEAVAAFPDPEAIYEKNVETLERIGLAGWQALDVDAPKNG
jgi:hypothetical protein